MSATPDRGRSVDVPRDNMALDVIRIQNNKQSNIGSMCEILLIGGAVRVYHVIS